MSITTRVAGVVVAAAALCGVGAGIAAASTPAPLHLSTVHHSGRVGASSRVGAPLLTQGFTFFNNSARTVEYTKSFSPDGGTWDGGPSNGTMVAPGGTLHWEQTYWFTEDTHEDLTFVVMNGNHQSNQSFEFETDISGSNVPSSTYMADNATSVVGTASVHNLVINDAPQYIRNFNVTNLSSRTFELESLMVANGQGWVDSTPAIHSLLQPGNSPSDTSDHFGMAYVPGTSQEVVLYFREVDPTHNDAPNGQAFLVRLRVAPDGTATSVADPPGPLNVTVNGGGDVISITDAS